jgi:hypothetical protein
LSMSDLANTDFPHPGSAEIQSKSFFGLRCHRICCGWFNTHPHVPGTRSGLMFLNCSYTDVLKA